MEYRTENKEVKANLEALAYWIADDNYLIERYGTEEPERETAKQSIHLAFDLLDELKVPFWVQNTVICFAENWRRYKSEYLDQYLKTKNIFI